MKLINERCVLQYLRQKILMTKYSKTFLAIHITASGSLAHAKVPKKLRAYDYVSKKTYSKFKQIASSHRIEFLGLSFFVVFIRLLWPQ